ncbi:MAG: helix-turn-helix domain-containing protein, partial [Clostridiales bacterium]|nr:helix-turn-helix domain-containing protein [Clostridiales bacterium]
MEVGKRLKNIRKKRKYSQYRLAQKSGVSQSFLSSLEAGEKSPTINILGKICQALGISLSEFFSEETPEFPSYLKSLVKELRYLSPEQAQNLATFLDS